MLFPSPGTRSSRGAAFSPPGPGGKTRRQDPQPPSCLYCHHLQRTQRKRWKWNFVGREKEVGWVSPRGFHRRERRVQSEGMRDDSAPSHLPHSTVLLPPPAQREEAAERTRLGQEHRASQAPVDRVLPFQPAHGQCQSGFGGHSWRPGQQLGAQACEGRGGCSNLSTR